MTPLSFSKSIFETPPFLVAPVNFSALGFFEQLNLLLGGSLYYFGAWKNSKHVDYRDAFPATK